MRRLPVRSDVLPLAANTNLRANARL
eukprot:COSAG04_NODE_30694_length_261_cov_0.641975_1_plen_25_part_01